ncbi:hypothetical protein BJ684DRAFT_20714 [Piptocephalis cylindrospora]|uniref:Uncharacterized protein n=1 Tax=Piptocephalis cylindrospora TaxID=1907219 RepID=A0A4P9Y4J1_9FUNG|nr:hypothetical protein BJ684DRAFT_20714 [Piptocephalis cylindrospora]|eukprot:RKP12760.1 hypothetical protein BJ684DRAFT_20714 [Piptocephalis cylindrospora]
MGGGGLPTFPTLNDYASPHPSSSSSSSIPSAPFPPKPPAMLWYTAALLLLLCLCSLDSAAPKEAEEADASSLWSHLVSYGGNSYPSPVILGLGSAAVEMLWTTGRHMKNSTTKAKAKSLEKKRARAERYRAEMARKAREAWLAKSKAERRRQYFEQEEEYKKNQVKLYQQYMVQKQQMEVLQRHQQEPWDRYSVWLDRPDVKALLTPEILEELSNQDSPLAQTMPILVLAHPTDEEMKHVLTASSLPMASPLSTMPTNPSSPVMSPPISIPSFLVPPLVNGTGSMMNNGTTPVLSNGTTPVLSNGTAPRLNNGVTTPMMNNGTATPMMTDESTFSKMTIHSRTNTTTPTPLPPTSLSPLSSSPPLSGKGGGK